MKKKLISLCLCISLAAALTGCGGNDSAGTAASADGTSGTARSSASGSSKTSTSESSTSGSVSASDWDSVKPLDITQYLLPENVEKTDALIQWEKTDILNGHDTSEFVKEGPYEIGVSFQDLTNPVWAGIAQYIQEFGKEHNMSFTISDCGGDASTQVSQLESYIESGVDGIFIGGVDGEALKDVTAKALDAGIPVMGIALTFGYGNCILVPSDNMAGEACAEQAAQWIDDKFDGKCQVAILNYPQEISLLDRGNAIKKKLQKLCPDAEIVAEKAAINTTEGYDATESILQAYPDVKVICTIGDGGAVGACEAVIAAGKNTDDFGVFGIDGTNEAVQAINDPENPYRSSISYGNSIGWAKYCVDDFMKIFSGEDYKKFELMPVIPVTNENLLAYAKYSGMEESQLKS